MSADRELDKWAAWVLHRRDGDDPGQHEKALEQLLPIRDRVLDNARIQQGETLLDVGTGDGLIAFGALERVGPGGRVIASDISGDLVARTREIADELPTSSGSSPTAPRSIGSVLIYVDNKASPTTRRAPLDLLVQTLERVRRWW